MTRQILGSVRIIGPSIQQGKTKLAMVRENIAIDFYLDFAVMYSDIQRILASDSATCK